MSTTTYDAVTPVKARSTVLPAWLSINHATTIFISAFLLFQVQPLISKFILPWFGGSPAVWTTCMLFFQILLFGGYAYAHWSTQKLRPKSQAILHLVLLVAACAMLPIIPGVSWKPTDGSDPTWRILALLSVSVGLPYFVLSTTGPLVQHWFSRAFAGRSPYRLYSLSNIGSLLALVSYPFVIEPAWDVSRQAWVWSGLFAVFALLCGVGAAWNWRLGDLPRALEEAAAAASHAISYAKPTALRRLLWLALPACASLMLLATTNHVCQDVAVVPFLWVVPLSLYLLTFIICFDQERWYRPLVFSAATVLAVLAVAGRSELFDLVDRLTGHQVSFVQELSLYFGLMFLVCMTCHGELVRLRPSPEHLTEFYLMISAGGALGGVFVSLVAPRIFTTFFEWKISLVLAFVIAVVVTFRNLAFAIPNATARNGATVAAGAIGVALISYWQSSGSEPVDRAANFYGIVSVWDNPEETYENKEGKMITVPHNIMMRHGAIAHGRQHADKDKRQIAVSYYNDKTGIGRAMSHVLQRPNVHVGTIGLGVGTTATFAREGDRFRFYEINPEVVRQAKEFFTFLKDCKGDVELVMGDARLALEREEPQQFDLLICDAFSGDSIPAHLATEEAFAIYKKHLKRDGILAVNITNSYIDIFPVIRAMADHYDFKWTRIYTQREPEQLLYRTDWMLLTNEEEFLAANPVDVPEEYRARMGKQVARWTDHFSNLFEVLK